MLKYLSPYSLTASERGSKITNMSISGDRHEDQLISVSHHVFGPGERLPKTCPQNPLFLIIQIHQHFTAHIDLTLFGYDDSVVDTS